MQIEPSGTIPDLPFDLPDAHRSETPGIHGRAPVVPHHEDLSLLQRVRVSDNTAGSCLRLSRYIGFCQTLIIEIEPAIPYLDGISFHRYDTLHIVFPGWDSD